MARVTVDFGIDLGTTNSEITHLKGTSVEVIKNLEGIDYTPSAVWLDRGGNFVVGRTAREYAFRDPGNVFTEFKLQMGSDAECIFARTKRRATPEELSAEVLKSLRENVRSRLGEELEAAVITVPAAFEWPQSDATHRAAVLAGIRQAPLLQEPVAAALAYGFQAEDQRAMWLVFDFGGGTFDAAVMSVRDGVIQVVNHGGDNHLGGKVIDWAVVERLSFQHSSVNTDLSRSPGALNDGTPSSASSRQGPKTPRSDFPLRSRPHCRLTTRRTRSAPQLSSTSNSTVQT